MTRARTALVKLRAERDAITIGLRKGQLIPRHDALMSLGFLLKADVEQLRLEKQTAFETQTEGWRNSEQGDRLADEIALLEDLRDALKTVLHQVHDRFTPET